MLINRKIINTDIIFKSDFRDYYINDFFNLIDKWKWILHEKYGARRGQIVTVSVLEVKFEYVCIVFAAAELGLKLITLNQPVSYDTIHKTKLAMFGPADFAIVPRTNKPGVKLTPHGEMVERYSKNLLHIKEVDLIPKDANLNFDHEKPVQDDILIMTSTSGTTEQSRLITWSHKDVFECANRNINIFKYEKSSRVGHTRNMHHGSSAVCEFFPALMTADFHTNINTAKETMMHAPHYTKEYGLTHISIKNVFDLQSFLEFTEEPFKETLIISMSGFTVPDYFVDLCKQYNIKFISHFGSMDIAVPLLVNYVDCEYHFRPHYLGVMPDNFYTINIVEGKSFINCKSFETEKLLSDRLRLEEDGFYHEGRLSEDNSILCGNFTLIKSGENTHIVIWEEDDFDTSTTITSKEIENLDSMHVFNHGKRGLKYPTKSILRLKKKDFTTDTKVDMDQLRAYLDAKLLYS
jgi:hypothetical protein